MSSKSSLMNWGKSPSRAVRAAEQSMRALRSRAMLPAEYLSEVERIQTAAMGERSPVHIGSLAMEENARVAASKQTHLAISCGASGGGGGGVGSGVGGGGGAKAVYSSAALLAVQEVMGVQISSLQRNHAAHELFAPLSHRARSPDRSHGRYRSPMRSHSPAPSSVALEPSHAHPQLAASARLPLDAELLEVASAAQHVLLTSTLDPSPAAVSTIGAAGAAASHQYMRTHALHHHLPLDMHASSSSGVGGGGGAFYSPASLAHDADAARVGLGSHLVASNGFQPSLANAPSLLDSGAPLKSTSAALHMGSPSSQADWRPPSVACTQLNEEIYAASKSLAHIISTGEGRDAHERHLLSIRPPRVAEELRKRTVAESAIASIQAAAAAKHATKLRESQLANAAALAQKRERERVKAERAKIRAAKAAAIVAGKSTVNITAESVDAAAAAAEIAAENGATAPGSPTSTSGSSSAAESRTRKEMMWARAKSASLQDVQEMADAAFAERTAANAAAAVKAAAAAATAAASSMDARAAALSKAKTDGSFSRHRAGGPGSNVTRWGPGASCFGPHGENVAELSRLTIAPASKAAGHILDLSVAASAESSAATMEQKRLHALHEYNASLARLYKAVTPQTKRLRRLDAPQCDREDVRRVVEASLGLREAPNGRRAFQ